MRVGIVRTDLGRGVYLADVESRVQRCFSSEVPGQSRNIRRPTDDELLALVVSSPLPVADIGSDTAATVNTTSPANVLKIRTNPAAAYTSITVTSGATTAKTTLVTDLNAGFLSAGLALHASVVGTNQLQIATTDAGPHAFFQLDTNASGHSTLNPIVGFTPGAFAAPSRAALLTALKAAVYPTGTTFNVAASIIEAVGVTVNTTGTSKFSLLSDGGVAFAAAVADLVAPQLVETGDVILSFVAGIMSKLRVSTYEFDGVTGQALYATANDGSTAFSYP